MRKILRPIVLSLLLMSSAHVSALASDWTVRADESHLGFVARQAETEFEGSFGSFQANIQFDPADLENAIVEVRIDISSLHGISEDRHGIAMSRDWFGLQDFAQAVFSADTFHHLEGSSYEAVGTLTLKGVTLPFTLPFELTIEEDIAYMTSFSQVLRRDYAVGTGDADQWFGNEVDLSISLVADRR